MQVGDYGASAFYHFAKRGHRYKCWECGVKKKAPCGNTERADLPWCCHRRLGAFMPVLAVSRAPTGAIALTGALVSSAGSQKEIISFGKKGHIVRRPSFTEEEAADQANKSPSGRSNERQGPQTGQEAPIG